MVVEEEEGGGSSSTRAMVGMVGQRRVPFSPKIHSISGSFESLKKEEEEEEEEKGA